MSPNKRKDAPAGNGESKGAKRSKGGSGGRWQTPHQKTKLAASRGHGAIEPGDVGIWATCARSQEGRATTELKSLLYQCAERFYGIAAQPDESDDEEDGDIEASIRKEVAAMGDNNGKPEIFSPVRLDVECVLFFKTQPPIDPVDLVHRMCEDVASGPGPRTTRYINRLTPMALMGKATEKGLAELARTVLGEHFQLTESETTAGDDEKSRDESKTKQSSHSYAIRPTIRNHNTLKRDMVIKQVASLIGNTHAVNLTKPDKVILIEIYQTVCGMSVVGGDWETLKRYNLSELYQPRPKVTASADAGATQTVDGPKREGVPATSASTATDGLEPSK